MEYEKYRLYKKKYLNLKKQTGGYRNIKNIEFTFTYNNDPDTILQYKLTLSGESVRNINIKTEISKGELNTNTYTNEYTFDTIFDFIQSIHNIRIEKIQIVGSVDSVKKYNDLIYLCTLIMDEIRVKKIIRHLNY